MTKISLMKQDNVPETFEIQARVVRVNETSFALEFTDLDDHRQDELWECLAYESQQYIDM